MARDTQVIVRVPSDFQIELSGYLDLLLRAGVKLSKADAIIRLARIGCKSETEELNRQYDDSNEG